MSYYGLYSSVSSFVKFGGQMTKNVYDVRKVFLAMNQCVYAYFVKFYMIVLDEIIIVDPKLVYEHVFCWKISVKHPERPSKGP